MKCLPRVRPALIVMGAMMTLLSACQSDPASHEQSVSSRQEDALKRPFDYSPNIDNPNISGGGIGEFDSKAFGKDLSHVLDP